MVTDAAGTLDRRTFAIACCGSPRGLRAAGVGPGARVALWLPNSAAYLAAIFACARLGALAIHINTRFRTAEVGNLLRRSRAVALVTQWGFPPVDFPAIFAALPIEDRGSMRCVLGPDVPPGVSQIAGLPVLPLDGAAADAGADEATARSAVSHLHHLGHDQRAEARPARSTNHCRTRRSTSPAGSGSMLPKRCCSQQSRSAARSATPRRWPRSPAGRMSSASRSSMARRRPR